MTDREILDKHIDLENFQENIIFIISNKTTENLIV